MEEPAWRATVLVEADEALAGQLVERLERGPAEPSVWVTDLLDPRPAFYRRRVRVPTPPERRERQSVGRALHALIGSVLAAPGYLEVRVRREGIVGQVDLLEQEPTELKTTASLPEPASLIERRASYLAQLAMYCALTDRPAGRLVVVQAADGTPGPCQVYEVRFRSLAPILERMRARAASLRTADAENRPDALPRCGWYGRGCEFQLAGVCSCTGAEPPAADLLGEEVEAVRMNPGLTEGLASQLAGLSGIVGPPAVERFRDLLYPRRAYFERTEPPPEAEGAEEAPVPVKERADLYRSLLDALEGGPPGEATRVPVPTGEPLERVACLNGRPLLVKVTRAPRSRGPSELLSAQPHYFLDLGFRCASIGQPEGLLVLGYERLEDPRERVRAYRVRFTPLEVVGGLASDRAAARARALVTAQPATLPACPDWMFRDCPYRERCGCGPAPGGARYR